MFFGLLLFIFTNLYHHDVKSMRKMRGVVYGSIARLSRVVELYVDGATQTSVQAKAMTAKFKF